MASFANALFFIAGLVLAGWSLLYVSQATLGVWMMAGACFLSINARLFQSEAQHQAILRQLKT